MTIQFNKITVDIKPVQDNCFRIQITDNGRFCCYTCVSETTLYNELHKIGESVSEELNKFNKEINN